MLRGRTITEELVGWKMLCLSKMSLTKRGIPHPSEVGKTKMLPAITSLIGQLQHSAKKHQSVERSYQPRVHFQHTQRHFWKCWCEVRGLE